MNYIAFYNIYQTTRNDVSTPTPFLNVENEDKLLATASDSVMRNSVIPNSGLLRPHPRHIE